MEEENEQSTVMQVSVKWGLIMGIISIVLFLTFYFGGLMGESWIGFIGPVITAGLMYLAHKEFKDQGNGFMSYGQGLGIGTLLAAISGAIYSIFSYVYAKFINPDYMLEILDMTRAKLEDEGQSDEQIEMAMEMMQGFMTPEMTLAIGLVGAIFIGFIIALIISAITKNNDPSLEV